MKRFASGLSAGFILGLLDRRGVERMTANVLIYEGREPAWHKLGVVWGRDSRKSASQAVRDSGLDYQVTAVPLEVAFQGTSVPTNKVALIREPIPAVDPEPRFLGVAGHDYTPIQNREIAQMLDPLTEKWPVETIGALGHGETAFLCLDAGAGQVAGEDVERYFLVSDFKACGEALKIASVRVRVVCQNTLMLALSNASTVVKINHGRDVRREFDWYVQLMAKLKGADLAVQAALERMAATRLVEAQVDEILRRVWPEPSVPGKVQLRNELDAAGKLPATGEGRVRLDEALRVHEQTFVRHAELRSDALELYGRFNDEFPSLAGTGWALVNAVTELADHRLGRFAAQSAVFGERRGEKEAAAAAILAVAA